MTASHTSRSKLTRSWRADFLDGIVVQDVHDHMKTVHPSTMARTWSYWETSIVSAIADPSFLIMSSASRLTPLPVDVGDERPWRPACHGPHRRFADGRRQPRDDVRPCHAVCS
jgi:hypothetical protein